MADGSYRLAAPAGRLIDRARPLPFTWDGRRLNGFAGDTLASALLANGVRTVAHSFKLHRPRGIMGIGAEEVNALVTVGAKAEATPNLLATEVPLTAGLVARSQNAWPSLRYDIGALADMAKPLLPPGFHLKTFKSPARLRPLYEKVLRRTAGMGQARTAPDTGLYEHLHITVDVLVVGGGLAGLAAAETAAAEGLTVLVAEAGSRLGGIVDAYDGTVDGTPLLAWTRARVAALAAAGNVHLLPSATVLGLYDHGLALICERVDGAGSEPHLAERLWHVRARSVVLATGALEKPLVFPDNDRPGIMLATAARLYLRRYGVVPGRRIAIVTASDEGYRTATDLRAAGADIVQLVDLRLAPDGAIVHMLRAGGLAPALASAPVGVNVANGGHSLRGLRVANRITTDGPAETHEVECDTILVSGGWSPSAQLAGHLGHRLTFDPAVGGFRANDLPPGLIVAGAANGVFDAATVLDDGWRAGMEAARHVRGEPARGPAYLPDVQVTRDDPIEPVAYLPDIARPDEEARAFVDLQNDVTVGDLRLAIREGYGAPEHIKRYTMLSLAPDQGKLSIPLAAAVEARLSGRPAEEVAHTTFRPPWTPVSLGALAGARRGALYRPVREGPLDTGSADAPVVDEGAWRRHACFPQPGETVEDAICREAAMVRLAGGILDASPLGKIAVSGPDAGHLLDNLCMPDIPAMPVGSSMTAWLLNDDGFITDEGMIARLAEHRFLLTVTASGADSALDGLERLRYRDLHAFVTDETDRWGQALIAGPRCADILAAIEAPALPAGRIAEASIGSLPCRLAAFEDSGVPAAMLAVPSGYFPAFWGTLREAAAAFGAGPFGVSTLARLRLEAGQPTIGRETDGMVRPDDLGVPHASHAKAVDFAGKRALAQPGAADPDRGRLVGILTENGGIVLPVGTHLHAAPIEHPPRPVVGHVTSAGHSPALGRAVALAMVSARHAVGEQLFALHSGEMQRVSVVEPNFLDRRQA